MDKDSKLIVIVLLLFLVTAMIFGTLSMGIYMDSKSKSEIAKITLKINSNLERINSINLLINELRKEGISSKEFDKTIRNIEVELEDLGDSNEDIEDDIKRLRKEILKLYALFPSGY